LTAFSRDGTFCTNCCLGATAKKLNEKASLYEGHGFSRAVNRMSVARLQPLRYAFAKLTGLRFPLWFSANWSFFRSLYRPRRESGLELTLALPKLFMQPRAISALQVQHPLRSLSTGEILDRHLNGLHLVPWIDEFFPNEKSRGSPALQQRCHFLLDVGLMSYRKQLDSFAGYEMRFNSRYEHVMFSPEG
jgi:hypothetical protein